MNFGKRSTAVTLCIIMIAVAILLGGRIGLMKLRNAAVELFESGDPETATDMGIQYDLDRRAAFAGNLVVVAKRYLDEDDKLIKNVTAACDDLDKAADPNRKYKANEALTSACTALHDRLAQCDLSESDIRYNDGIIADMESCNQIIGHSQYNDAAESFNTLLGKFPTSVVRLICGVKKLTLFAY